TLSYSLSYILSLSIPPFSGMMSGIWRELRRGVLIEVMTEIVREEWRTLLFICSSLPFYMFSFYLLSFFLVFLHSFSLQASLSFSLSSTLSPILSPIFSLSIPPFSGMMSGIWRELRRDVLIEVMTEIVREEWRTLLFICSSLPFYIFSFICFRFFSFFSTLSLFRHLCHSLSLLHSLLFSLPYSLSLSDDERDMERIEKRCVDRGDDGDSQRRVENPSFHLFISPLLYFLFYL